MKRNILRLVTRGLVSWLANRLPPAGRPPLHDLEARSLVLIDAVPDGGLPGVDPDPERLDEAGLRACLDWLFAALAAARAGDSWAQLAVHCLRAWTTGAEADILAAATQAPAAAEVKP